MSESLPIIVLLIALILGIPIAFALAGAGILGVYLFTGSWESVIGQLGTTLFTTASEYLLTTIPMFILMAYFASSSGLARDLFNGLSNWLSHIRGGLAIATVFSCGIFGAMS
ncbi:MAG: TRAP transporter large permease subunit [Thermodesulfobacteriota bacterium]